MTLIITVNSAPTEQSLVTYQNSKPTFTWQVKDENGAQVDLTGHTLQLLIHDRDGTAQRALVSGSDVVLGASVGNTPKDEVTVTIQPAVLADLLGVYAYKVWDLTANMVYGTGAFVTKLSPLPGG